MFRSEIDWKAAEAVAERLGVHTRQLVAGRDVEAAIAWALRLSSEHGVYAGNQPRSATYLELAVLLGHELEPADEAA